MSVLVIGELLVDLIWRTEDGDRITPHAGGSPANVALGLQRLDRPVTLATCWGDDPDSARRCRKPRPCVKRKPGCAS